MSGYKRMRREHQAALVKLEEKCKVEMEAHKNALDKEYDNLLHNFTRELERLEVSFIQRKTTRIQAYFSIAGQTSTRSGEAYEANYNCRKEITQRDFS